MKKEAAHVIPIVCALVTAIAPHVPGLPVWIILWCFCMWGYMLVRLKTGWPLPGAFTRHGLTLAGIMGLLITFRFSLGPDAFVGLLALMAAIKPFEMKTHRHQMITLLLVYFIIITSLFRSDSLWILLYMVFSVFVTTTAVARINNLANPLKNSMGLTTRILAQAIPLAMVLFLLFPRLQDSLVGVKAPRAGTTGFSQTLEPGSISHLARDPALAFRASFSGKLPMVHDLYWRGIVFDAFDGRRWRSLDKPPMARSRAPSNENGLACTIILEPSQSPWLIALDRPILAPPGSELTPDLTLKSRQTIRRKKTYQVVSLSGPSLTFGPLPLPMDLGNAGNPKARQLAGRLAGNISLPEKKLDQILAYFKKDFTYTLSPPLAGPNPIDHFLVDTRQGYCEHYATALAFMMNVLGVPARVVGGYLGGELNPYGNYLSIRRSHAHVWVEVFLPPQGWVRTDPTLVVSPGRLDHNPDGTPARLAMNRISMFKKTAFFLEAVNLEWESWFTGYANAGQRALLRYLGFGRAQTNGLTLPAGLTALALAGFFFLFQRIFKPDRSAKDRVRVNYTLFCQRLARIGIERKSSQGPMELAQMAARIRPDLEPEITPIIDLYIRLRFHAKSPKGLEERFIASVSRFKPKNK